jgi:hypothetical protein
MAGAPLPSGYGKDDFVRSRARGRCVAMVRETSSVSAAPPRPIILDQTFAEISDAVTTDCAEALLDCYLFLSDHREVIQSPSNQFYDSVISHSCSPNTPFSSAALRFVAGDKYLFSCLLHSLDWDLLNEFCRDAISGDVFNFFAVFFGLPQTHQLCFEKGLFQSLTELHATEFDDNLEQLLFNFSLIVTIISRTTYLPEIVVDMFMSRLDCVCVGAVVEVPEDLGLLFLKVIYHCLVFSDSERVLTFVHSNAFQLLFQFTRHRVMVGSIVCEVCCAAMFPEIRRALEQRRFFRFVVQRIGEARDTAATLYMAALAALLRESPAAVGELLGMAELAAIAECVDDGAFEMKVHAALAMCELCRWVGEEKGVGEWLQDHRVVSSVVELAGEMTHDAVRDYFLRVLLALVSRNKEALTEDDVEVLRRMECELADIIVAGVTGGEFDGDE